MKIGIVGLPMVGKTTLFNLLTNARTVTSNFFSGKTDANVGVARVPDNRIDWLSKLYKPRKTIHAQIEFTDVPGLVRGASQGEGVGNQFLTAIRTVDALVHVVRAFANKEVPHVEGSIDPVRDIETVNMELLFADLEVIEKRIERLEGAKKRTKENEAELVLMRRLREALESETSLHSLELADQERALIRSFTFLTEKPVILVVNVDETQFKSGEYPGKAAVDQWAKHNHVPVLEVCGQIEVEISRLELADRTVFMEDLGLKETGIERLARVVYERLGLISFFTVGEDEVKAWTIEKGTHARKAAGKIHSDIERGFIRAEVVAYQDLAECGSMAKVREKGLFRLEGKDYLVADGDIINFRFNV
ncbi:MAG: redox-regulated ATPase YchF [Syntrophothermus sp.]